MSLHAMKQALEALNEASWHLPDGHTVDRKCESAIAALTAAIDQAEKAEPVAIAEGDKLYWIAGRAPTDDKDRHLYFTTPPDHTEVVRKALEAAYYAGFMSSEEGRNGEWPFTSYDLDPREDEAWIKARDEALDAIKPEQIEGK